MSVLDKLTRHYREAKATLEGKAISKARLIKTLTAIDATQLLSRSAPKIHPEPGRFRQFFRGDLWRRRMTFRERMQWLYERRPRATKIGLRMLDGRPMVYFTDGSLRHVYGRKTAKAARKKLKLARRSMLGRRSFATA